MSAFEFPVVLYIDTALQACVLGLKHEGKSYAQVIPMTRGHAEALMPAIEGFLDEHGVVCADLDAIVTCRGPGSFTGLRTGISAAKSMALALGVPVFGVSSLQAVAWSCDVERPFLVVLESKREDFYVQGFGYEDQVFLEAGTAKGGEILSFVAEYGGGVSGDGALRLKQGGGSFEEYKCLYADPHRVLKCFDDPVQHEAFIAPFQPLYLRGADVSFSKKMQRVLASDG